LSFPYVANYTIRVPLGADDDTTNIIVQASFDGRLKHDEGFLSATGDLCTLTAAASKDLYLSAAKVVFFVNVTNGSEIAQEVVLKVNGTIVETSKATITQGATNDSGSSNMVYEFKNLWHKVDATQILKLEVITLDADVDVEGFIQAVEVPDTENPVTYTGA
jgi:hypothetical protein